ncbi:enoyl-CoA hydratase-related protein [uncultured Croceicoccus sp.]|uniref:enoyl-CoA hydratase/isomerase family protein n=1 Tax=uncultured Croceicoccus sp. TaxID=1295329 RepID=UPI0026106010|nr:enoyl-CoA hydratase-related protein [uncultured Croceicoccus sp.]
MIACDMLDSGIARITLDRADAANALTLPLVAQLRGTIAELQDDPDVRLLILTARGGVFCAGLDLKEIVGDGEEAPDNFANIDLQERFAALMCEISESRFPVIAALNGPAVGAGMGMALAADIRIAATTARFLIGAVKIGLSAGECGISYHLPRIVGAGRAFEMMLTGRAVDAEEAHRTGLVTTLCEPDMLQDEALTLARQITANSPYAVKHTKQVMRSNLEAPSLRAAIALENHVQCLALGTADFREGCEAFAQKRPPDFRGH